MKRFEQAGVVGWLHEPSGPASAAVALTHGAGSNSEAPFLRAAAESLAGAGYGVLRYDLPFQQHGVKTLTAPQQARDREGVARAAEALRSLFPGMPLVLAGHSYGGRQSSMLAAQNTGVAQALMLLSYPLHPPRQPEKLRTDHFPSLQMRCLFVHGTRDPFGTVDELSQAVKLIPGPCELRAIDKGAHNLPMSTAALLPEWLSAIMEL